MLGIRTLPWDRSQRDRRWLIGTCLHAAAAMGPILLVLLHMAAKDHARNDSCCGRTGIAACTFPAMPPALATGGRQSINLSSGARTASAATSTHATPGQNSSTALFSDLGHELPWLQVSKGWGLTMKGSFVALAHVMTLSGLGRSSSMNQQLMTCAGPRGKIGACLGLWQRTAVPANRRCCVGQYVCEHAPLTASLLHHLTHQLCPTE